MKIKLNVQYHADRAHMVLALANSGYRVWVEESSITTRERYYVCFELDIEKEDEEESK